MYNMPNLGDIPSSMFIAEYISRPPMAKIFYEDVLMAAVFYGYPLLVENNKYGIVRYFENRGYDEYVMDRPSHLMPAGSRSLSKTKGVPSNSEDFIQGHAQAIEEYIYKHVGVGEAGTQGQMLFNRTLEDWAKFDIRKRTKFDLTISSGLALLAAQSPKSKERIDFNEKKFFRRYNLPPIGTSIPRG